MWSGVMCNFLSSHGSNCDCFSYLRPLFFLSNTSCLLRTLQCTLSVTFGACCLSLLWLVWWYVKHVKREICMKRGRGKNEQFLKNLFIKSLFKSCSGAFDHMTWLSSAEAVFLVIIKWHLSQICLKVQIKKTKPSLINELIKHSVTSDKLTYK